MKAQDLYQKLFKGEQLAPTSPIVGHKSLHNDENICVCEGGGDDCEE
ncbi:hypothetical protein L6270_04995 [Candidatus Parcubacteria bacterium]|nr:hypothetical protein [Patescibacteria group bacterium]MBU4309318.1 hypothetical protein [Patescibacteria group bacterium]MBU4432295.1 hypothetical protein [Patescibacteria group bacterium]MBU4577679.1 hypothetical protein [Patescibacteria group bacterium]MCG2697365.1 hypothetical protein [Candidatus Parcubacteria bacterium]